MSSQKKINLVVVVHFLCSRSSLFTSTFIYKLPKTDMSENMTSQNEQLIFHSVGFTDNKYHCITSCDFFPPSFERSDSLLLGNNTRTSETFKSSICSTQLKLSKKNQKDVTHSKASNIHEHFISKAFLHLDAHFDEIISKFPAPVEFEDSRLELKIFSTSFPQAVWL